MNRIASPQFHTSYFILLISLSPENLADDKNNHSNHHRHQENSPPHAGFKYRFNGSTTTVKQRHE